MRIGYNPQKDKVQAESDFFHQVVIPVYIPNRENYFRDSFKILRLCLQSLFKTSHNRTYFTVVNNGSCDEVRVYLDELFQEGKIHEIVNTTNIGYVNAMLKGITGHKFAFITNTDADVLFLDNWQEESYAVFSAFPKTGVVSPTPNSRMIKYLTGNVFFDKGFSRSVSFTDVMNPEAMKAFAKSIDHETVFKAINFKKYLTISKEQFKAVIGAGHFVVTYRSDIFDELKTRYSKILLGEDSVFDVPVIENGFWRLSTADNYAYHMGNVLENWMLRKVEELQVSTNEYFTPPELVKCKSNAFLNWFKNHFFARLLFKKPIWRLFLRYKGLNKEDASIYY